MTGTNSSEIVEDIRKLVRENLDFNQDLKDEDILCMISELVFDKSSISYIRAEEKKEIIYSVFNRQSDYVSSNNAVGKLHAEIINKDGIYYLKDLNSRNGTFINGERIVSNIEHLLQGNDTISFATSEYRFLRN
jgi:pSer/pThr/pTyr-binding forkhead associated (FHA) protein